ncbi:hypothetical protein ACQPT2_17485 [Erwinia amylovora]
MVLIDEFLNVPGFQADLRGGQAFEEQLQRTGDPGESTDGYLPWLAGVVPTTLKVNTHALSEDITLTSSDVGAYPLTGEEIKSQYGQWWQIAARGRCNGTGRVRDLA